MMGPEAPQWCVEHPGENVVVEIRCPRKNQRPCLVGEVQQTPHGRVLSIYLRGLPPTGKIEPVGPRDDLSNYPLNLARSVGLPTQHRRRPIRYNADSFPEDWERTLICRCAQGTITGPQLTAAIERSRHAAKAVVIAFHAAT